MVASPGRSTRNAVKEEQGAAYVPRSRRTCVAQVESGFPDELALGAARGVPVAAISARATRCAGMCMVTVGWSAVMMSGTRVGSVGKRRVSGPGQNFRISAA